ncbi:AAA family ATPase [Desulfovibrio sp. OttesenSCG-928-G15]|nr:AAA family ATPase [Desulfovibrio sp. OttesenSCG-928-G15]
MLELLRIRNLALIEDLEIELSPGMNVLTGETGAGKSFILKALNFLTGDRLGTDMVRPGKERAVVEALFILDGEECILRRELAAESGRSRLYKNDRLVSQESIRDLRPRLILHTSQHGQQKLLQPAFQAAILDDFLNRPDLLHAKDTLLKDLSDLAAKIDALDRSRLSLEDKRDVLEYQLAEIEKVAPKPGEEEELENQRAAARNQADISGSANLALVALLGDDEGPGMLKRLTTLEKNISVLAGVLDDFSPHAGQLVEMRVALQDMESSLRSALRHASQETDMDAIEERLYALAQLKRKLKRSLSSIFALRQEIEENIIFLDSCEIERKELVREEQRLCEALSRLLTELNPARENAGVILADAIQAELKELGFSDHVRVFFEFTPHVLYKKQPELLEQRARILWQPNPGQPPQALDRIASGGELSRFLLAVVSLMSKTGSETPTLIFDEVDSGVGGLTLNRVAESLDKLSASRQMLLITHWPQLAAHASRHFVVSKDVHDEETFTRCTRLAPDEISQELSRMAGQEK